MSLISFFFKTLRNELVSNFHDETHNIEWEVKKIKQKITKREWEVKEGVQSGKKKLQQYEFGVGP
jgi:hypothetical protein